MPALNKNTLTRGVDLPTWEWTRFAPLGSSSVSSSSYAENPNVLWDKYGRYIYYLVSVSQFWRYDTWSDVYQQLQSLPAALSTTTSMKFMGDRGPEGNVLSATSTTLQVPAVTQNSLVGYDIVIVSGTGAGQRRTITSVAEPVIHDSGVLTGVSNSGGAIILTDTLKAWTGNQYAGYTVRAAYNTGTSAAGQIRRILSNTSTALTVGDTGQTNKIWNNPGIFSPGASSTAGSQTFYTIESQVITVDSAWTTTPDSTSVFQIQSGIILAATVASSGSLYTLQAYDILTDTWYVLPSSTNILQNTASDISLERTSENASIWEKGIATSGTTTTLVDASHGVDIANWQTNQWAGYWVFIFSGTAAGQIRQISSNTGNTLTWSSAGTAPDSTSRYMILGFDAGTATAGAASTLTDSTKSWATNRWANYVVRILHGTGRGQTRIIASNTATVLTVQNAWDTNPDNTSVYAIQGDPDRVYITTSSIAAIPMFHLDSTLTTYGRQFDWGIARNAAATVAGHQPVAISTLANSTTTATVTTAHTHQFRVGDLVTVRGATDANFNVTNVAITTVPSGTSFTYTMAGTPAATTITGSQSTTTLTDLTKNWTTNEHAGRLVYFTTSITAGNGHATAQSMRIASNTATTLTFSSTATAPTNGTSRYSIASGSAIGALDFGVATGGSQSTTAIQDTSKSWATNIYAGRRVRVLTSSGPTEVSVSSNTSNTLTLTNAIIAPTAGTTQYAILEQSVRSSGQQSNWAFGTSNASYRGRYIFIVRGGGAYGVERLDLTTDRFLAINTVPLSETFTTGTMTAYDRVDRIYIQKDISQRVLYLDVVTGEIHCGSMYPYAAGSSASGNRMEIFSTKDGLKYLWLNRPGNTECFRCLLFW